MCYGFFTSAKVHQEGGILAVPDMQSFKASYLPESLKKILKFLENVILLIKNHFVCFADIIIYSLFGDVLGWCNVKRLFFAS